MQEEILKLQFTINPKLRKRTGESDLRKEESDFEDFKKMDFDDKMKFLEREFRNLSTYYLIYHNCTGYVSQFCGYLGSLFEEITEEDIEDLKKKGYNATIFEKLLITIDNAIRNYEDKITLLKENDSGNFNFEREVEHQKTKNNIEEKIKEAQSKYKNIKPITLEEVMEEKPNTQSMKLKRSLKGNVYKTQEPYNSLFADPNNTELETQAMNEEPPLSTRIYNWFRGLFS